VARRARGELAVIFLAFECEIIRFVRCGFLVASGMNLALKLGLHPWRGLSHVADYSSRTSCGELHLSTSNNRNRLVFPSRKYRLYLWLSLRLAVIQISITVGRILLFCFINWKSRLGARIANLFMRRVSWRDIYLLLILLQEQQVVEFVVVLSEVLF